jgi:hypothetical protein
MLLYFNEAHHRRDGRGNLGNYGREFEDLVLLNLHATSAIRAKQVLQSHLALPNNQPQPTKFQSTNTAPAIFFVARLMKRAILGRRAKRASGGRFPALLVESAGCDWSVVMQCEGECRKGVKEGEMAK